jgi:hypothetical protein
VDLSADALLELIIGNKIGLGSGSSGSNLEELLSPRSSRLDILDYIPEEGTDQHQLDEPQITLEISDDANALSALTKSPQGISSTYAALKPYNGSMRKQVVVGSNFRFFRPKKEQADDYLRCRVWQLLSTFACLSRPTKPGNIRLGTS